jgi:NAD-dependent SIR2 family protein deacetylase
MRSERPIRPDQDNSEPAHEFLDEPDVLAAKVRVLASLIRQSRNTVVYAGAGLSKAAGIPDYASRGPSIATCGGDRGRVINALLAKPTEAHHVIAALFRSPDLHMTSFVQQNHDGLPQKAGMLQSQVNEIHGGNLDISNSVVQFSGSLRTDLFNAMLETEKNAQLVLCLGTSLSGMNADRVAEGCASRFMRDKALGTVIVNLQKTRLDSRASLRIWATLDEVFRLLAAELKLTIPAPTAYAPPPVTLPSSHTVPYDPATGLPSSTRSTTLDLHVGSIITVIHPDAPNTGARYTLKGVDSEGNILAGRIVEPGRPGRLRGRTIGRWWISEAVAGTLDRLPFVVTSADEE